jgi:hypothetical protein
MIGRMIAPSARIMLLAPLTPANIQKTTFSDDRQHLRGDCETRDPLVLLNPRFRVETPPDQFGSRVSEGQTFRVRDSANDVTHVVWQIKSGAHHDDYRIIASIIVSSAPDSSFAARNQCYTETVQRNITIKISEEAALWARRKAAEENTSISRFVGEMIERQMRLSDEYWRAFEHWKSTRPRAVRGAAERMSREDVHERR